MLPPNTRGRGSGPDPGDNCSVLQVWFQNRAKWRREGNASGKCSRFGATSPAYELPLLTRRRTTPR